MSPSRSVPLSVVMAVHNGARYLAEAIDSIRAQTFRDFELIVVDDGSTDDTARMLASVAAQESRLTIVRQQRQGLAASLNGGMAHASGDLVARHDADDRSMPSRFEQQIDFLRMHERVAAVGAGAVAVDADGREVRPLANPLGPAAVREGLRTLNATPVHGSMMLRRAAVLELGGYRPAFPAAQDLDLWLRLSERHDLDNLPDRLYRWRIHDAGVSATARTAQLMYAGIASAFAHERRSTGADSYALLESCDGDLDRFSRAYRLRGRLEGQWGELLFRGLNDPRVARPHLRAAIGAGHLEARTVGLFAWSLCGFHWPGGPTLQALSTHS